MLISFVGNFQSYMYVRRGILTYEYVMVDEVDSKYSAVVVVVVVFFI